MKSTSNYGRFMILWAGSMISQIGGGLTSFGLGVYIFNQTGSAARILIVNTTTNTEITEKTQEKNRFEKYTSEKHTASI